MHQHITAAEEGNLLRSISVSTTQVMLASDTDGNLVFGWTPGELVGRGLQVLLAPNQQDQVLAPATTRWPSSSGCR